MKSTLVTGGAGFIGSHLVRALREQGAQVRVLDDLSTGREENLDDLDVDLMVGDLRDASVVETAVEGTDVVFHLAAMVSVPESIEDPRRCYEVNVNGTLNLLWSAHKHGLRRVVLASSCAIYGDASRESVEEDLPGPLSPYASSKLAAENVASMFSRAYGLSTVNLRYFNVFGPGQRVDSPYAAVIPLFIDALLSEQPPTIYGDGLQTRDFVYVSDVVRANLLAANLEDEHTQVFNIAGPSSVSILKLVKILQKVIPSGPDPVFTAPREGDILHSKADKSAAASTLGYRPQIALEQGLQHTVQWYKSESRKLGI